MFISRKPAALLTAVSAVLLASASMAAAEGYGFIKPNISQFGEPVEFRIQKTDGNMKLRQDFRSRSAMRPVPTALTAIS